MKEDFVKFEVALDTKFPSNTDFYVEGKRFVVFDMAIKQEMINGNRESFLEVKIPLDDVHLTVKSAKKSDTKKSLNLFPQIHEWRTTGTMISTFPPFAEKRCVKCGDINWGGEEDGECEPNERRPGDPRQDRRK